MGKVLSSFKNGYAGAISRSVDDVVISMPVWGNNPVEFGRPVVLNTQKTAVIPFTSTSTAADIVGISVRSASKTPGTYGSNASNYSRKEMADILVRGSAVVFCASGTPTAGSPVYIVKADGTFTAESATDGTDNLLVPHMHFRGPKDTSAMAEVVILTRNIT